MSKQIYLDMDGVLADFVHGICEAHDRPNPYTDPANFGRFDIQAIWGMSMTEFWSRCNYDFWLGLPTTDIHYDIYSSVIDFEGNVCVLSSPSSSLGCESAKKKWLQKHWALPSFFGKDKWRLASYDKFLIDDYDKNIDLFRKAGGHAYLIPRPWNTLHGQSFDPEHLKFCLNYFMEL